MCSLAEDSKFSFVKYKLMHDLPNVRFVFVVSAMRIPNRQEVNSKLAICVRHCAASLIRTGSYLAK